ncbi:hypothetical protein MM221_06525 [Salipaludibacillus sp. LMS25]|uniref:hypothetical protein n=1 Tax=Salipaludibacillus sp. LMS25 TaxID=2924031 RepID=UPI0020D00ECC|nr:hypothetical protein [Salipaludibacillus sp. LMS25]UTR16208.1 hypothetical protein MM221_06525 [Salipaludibacillus sp. LMS25]
MAIKVIRATAFLFVRNELDTSWCGHDLGNMASFNLAKHSSLYITISPCKAVVIYCNKVHL